MSREGPASLDLGAQVQSLWCGLGVSRGKRPNWGLGGLVGHLLKWISAGFASEATLECVRVCVSLGIQLPSEKVFYLLKTPQTTFLEGIWIPRVCVSLIFVSFAANVFKKNWWPENKLRVVIGLYLLKFVGSQEKIRNGLVLWYLQTPIIRLL